MFNSFDLSDSERVAKQAKKAPRIFDGKFFIIEAQDDKTGNVEAKCTACNESKKGNVASTGNFLSHYKKKHSSQLEELKQYIKSGKLPATPLRQPILEEVLQSITDVNVCTVLYCIVIL